MIGVARCLFGKWVVFYDQICDKTKTKKETILPILNFDNKNLKDGKEIEFRIVKKTAEII